MKYSPTIFLLAARSLGLGKGANNTTRFVRVHDEQFVLRIYETHHETTYTVTFLILNNFAIVKLCFPLDKYKILHQSGKLQGNHYNGWF
jgi:hypothetical protein